MITISPGEQPPSGICSRNGHSGMSGSMNFADAGAIRIPKMAAVVAGDLRRQVLTGQLKPGDFLPLETQLAEQYSVARATVREAIRVLEAEGLVQISRGARHGAKILTPSASVLSRTMGVALQTRHATIRDVYDVRTVIEPFAARLAAQNNAAAASERLLGEVAVEAAVIERKDHRQMQRLLGHFHRTLMDCTGNITLSLLGAALEGPVTGHMSLLYSKSREDEWWAQMALSMRSRGRLARIIGEGDAEGAAAHWTTHMERTGRIWLSGVSQHAMVNIVDEDQF